jgi:hypothetical protein
MSTCGVGRLEALQRRVQDSCVRESRVPGRRGPALAILAGALVLAGCAADTNPVRDLFVATGVGGKVRQAPDFVAKSRPETLDYLPVGVSAPARPIRGKTAGETKAAEQELDAVRATNETRAAEARAAGATPPPAPTGVPAAAGTPPLRGAN